jgi:two-component system, chemotaxis family, sensor kinase CheA
VDQNEQLTQAQERIEQILSAFDALRVAMGNGKAERQLIDEIFRHVHSLKASAQTQELTDLTRLAHASEDVLQAIRTGRLTLDDHVLNLLNQTAETFLELLSAKESANTTALIKELAKISTTPGQRPKAEIEIILSALPSDLWQSLTDEEKHRLQASITESANLFLISTSFDIVDFDRQFQELKDRLNKTGELISTAPTVEQDRSDKIDFRILYTRQADVEVVRTDVASFAGVSVSAIEGVAPVASLNAAASSKLPLDRDPARYVRVSVEDLDQVISSAYSLARRTEDLPAHDSALKEKLDSVRESALELAASVVRVRLTSIERLLQRVERSGRAAARACGKEVNFRVSGQELLLDQSLCDAIADPLIHLVRNAVDHGIEASNERARSGKRAAGTVIIKATSSHGQTRIAIRDDGRGIDAKAIEAACVRMGLTHHQFPLALDESVRMIFRAGFSTAASVSETSGRGVGLDVVETEIERLGGQIRVASKPGVGSVFEIRLPVTFGLLDVVTVRVGQQRYAIDAVNVVSPENVPADEHSQFESLKLPELLGQPIPEGYERQSHAAILCDIKNDLSQASASSRRVRLLLDEVEKREQVVIRSLGTHASRWFGVAGATELRDGSVALLLDLSRLISR